NEQLNNIKGLNMADSINIHFPKSFKQIGILQNEFDIYQCHSFPERGANFFALELNGEAGELANLEKKAWKGIEIDMADFSDEAADVFIALLNYCNARGVDLASATETKMKKIEAKRIQELKTGE
ncbi:hypothetical protein K8I31_08965, partial [bacterium]|nr:hypothetical protein [bacterium]